MHLQLPHVPQQFTTMQSTRTEMKWRRFNLVRMPTMHESPVPLSRKHREKVKKHHDSVAHDAEVATTYYLPKIISKR